MQIIIYKIRLGKYELTDIKDSGGNDARIVFEEPIDGKLTLGNRVFNVTLGICKFNLDDIDEGEISPKLITGGGVKTLEAFITHRGTVLKKQPDAEYIRALAKAVDELASRLKSLEGSLDEIRNRINQKIEF